MYRSFAGLNYNVKFLGEIENYTKFQLYPSNTEVESGHISEPPSAITGGEMHAVSGHKVSDTATGCAGVMR